uniref:RWD domain-containing protein n=1 Tax=Panagrellus redivivus TaxID=6233 RepID=A0A7E5A1H5_PANRE
MTMEKFRQNAQVLHSAVTKRRLVASLTKRESRLQIFNSVFTRNRAASESDESDTEEGSRSSQRHRSRVKARIGAKAAANSTPSVDGSVSATAPASGPQSDGAPTARDLEGLFEYLSPISSTEDDCDEREGIFRRSVCMSFVEMEIRDMPPWIEATPLPPIEDRALAQDFAAQTDFPLRTKADIALGTEDVEFKVYLIYKIKINVQNRTPKHSLTSLMTHLTPTYPQLIQCFTN